MNEMKNKLKDLKPMIVMCVLMMTVGFFLITQTEIRGLSLAIFAICPLMHIFFMKNHKH
jgi:hypothetical protein